VQQFINPSVPIRFEPLPQDDPRRRRPDITRAQEWLGWQPTVDLEEGLKATIADFRERMANKPLEFAPVQQVAPN
jgi:UDP-glucuronate decarboxylase